MDTKRFGELKTRATQTLYILDTLTGNGAIIHERNKFHVHITYRLRRLKLKGEGTVVFRHLGKGLVTIYYTLDGLERKLEEANKFIAKVKGGNQ